jgi:hypothetical protein
MIEGYNTYRHRKNPIEKEIHDKFLQEFNQKGDDKMNIIIFGHGSETVKPRAKLTAKEKRIIVSAIQWLGSDVGSGFLKQFGFEMKNK